MCDQLLDRRTRSISLDQARLLIQALQRTQFLLASQFRAADGRLQHAHRFVVHPQWHGEGMPVLPAMRERKSSRVGEAIRSSVHDLGDPWPTGRPVLIIPYAGTFARVGTRVLIAWDGTREANRALHDVLPLIEDAEAVTVLYVGTRESDLDRARLRLERVVQHLQRHGSPRSPTKARAMASRFPMCCCRASPIWVPT
jgi:hypothetical protein